MTAETTPADRPVIVVTGGASGIGAACARLLAARGAKVVVADINGDAADDVAGEIGGVAHKADVREEAEIEALAARVEREIGPVSGLITSAGIIQPAVPPEEMDLELYDRIFAVNLRGTFLTLRAFAGPMKARGAGAMVAISSIAAARSVPLYAYAPTKAAVTNLVMGLAGEWGRSGLRVNCVEPGYTLTPALQAHIDRGFRNPSVLEKNSTLGRMVAPEEVAKAAAFLLSDEASAITGVALPVDAGFYCAGSWAPYGGLRPAG